MRKTGTVKFFDPDRGYGFAKPTDGSPDVFIHRTDLGPSCRREDDGPTLDSDELISFTVTDSGKGPKAIDVELEQ